MKIRDYFIWSCVGLEGTQFPNIYCPTCNSLLIYDRNSLHQEETSKSQPNSKDYITTSKYSCENCNELVIMTGISYSENQIIIYDDPHYNKDRILYSPLFFTPTIPLFNIHHKCPSEVKNEIIRSFALYWNDVDSCVNKLRLSIELLMDSLEIDCSSEEKSKRRLTLHQRIDLFKKKNRKVGEILEAIKWIGNKGSHANTKLIVNEVITAYELLEHALNELYEPQKDEMHDIAKEINKRKGILRKSRNI
jgi:hypothetical protein